MGNARWTSVSYDTYAKTTNYTSMNIRDVFNKSVSSYFSPRNITLRESRDSTENPNSTPIILGLDVTGSMGKYVHEIAVTHLPKLMSDILVSDNISDPHIMCMGIDDIHTQAKNSALQVSQFEADIRIVEQLRELYLVGGGGGNDSESYDLAWYFAAHKTSIDSFEKRGIPGFLFTFGDECFPSQRLTTDDLYHVFGDSDYKPMMPYESLAEAQKMYQVFHVIIEQGGYCTRHLNKVRSSWTESLGNNVLFLADSNYLSEVVLATFKIAAGENIHTVIKNSSNPEMLTYAFANALKN